MRLLALGIILLAGSSLAAPCPRGKLIQLSEDEMTIRIEQWVSDIERLDPKEKPGRQAKLLSETGLTPSDIENCQLRSCEKFRGSRGKPKRCR